MEGVAVDGMNGVGTTESKLEGVEEGTGATVLFTEGVSVDTGTNTIRHSSFVALNCVYP